MIAGALTTLVGSVACAAFPTRVIAIGELELRARGARFDGVADDHTALQSAIDAALQQSRASGSIAIAVNLPACRMLISAPIVTGGCNFIMRGDGREATTIELSARGTSALVHGTSSQPAAGSLELSDLTFEDGDAQGSAAAVGVSIVFGPDATQPAMVWRDIALRKWRAPSRIVNCPRNWHCGSVAVIGPDFAVQDGAAFEILSTSARGCFSYVFIDVLVSNYRWGWRYDIRAPLEGQRFIGCTCYNGWGMVQAAVSADVDAHHENHTGYRSLLWAFEDCDWQGLGFALDMYACRDVSIRGGYFIADLNKNLLKLPLPQPRRRYFSFSACEDVILDGVELDVLPGTEDTLALVYVDALTSGFVARDTIIASFSDIYAAWEFEHDTSTTRPNDRPREVDTTYAHWQGGERRRDYSK